jgi:hypothetical protein
VVKPISPERLRVSINNLLKVNALTEEVKRLNKKAGGALTFGDVIASSPAMANVMRLGRRAAPVEHPDPHRGRIGCRQGEDRPRHPCALAGADLRLCAPDPMPVMAPAHQIANGFMGRIRHPYPRQFASSIQTSECHRVTSP